MTDTTAQPDMNKVRAFLARKREQGDEPTSPPTQRSFAEEDGSVHYNVSIAGAAPVSNNLPPIAERVQAFAANNLHWQTLIYETMSLALDIEVNAAMPPMAIYSAVEARLKDMEDADKAVIPKHIWDAISALQKIVHGEGATIPNLRGKKSKPPRTTICPIRVEKMEEDTVAIFPVGGNKDTLASILDANIRWNHYRGLHSCEVRDGTREEGMRGWIVIKCADFARWPDADQVKQLFISFDKPVEGRLVGVED